MTAPRLSHALVLETPLRAADGAGGYVETWTALGTLWAEIAARSGRESDATAGPLAVGAYRITVRAAAPGSTERPRPGQRFVLGSRYFTIRAVTERDAAGLYLICHAEEEIAS